MYSRLKRQFTRQVQDKNIYDTNGELLAYNELSYAVTFEDKLTAPMKNGILNEIVYNAITIIEKYGDKVSYDFPIVINSDGNYEFNFTSDASRTLFMTNLFGKKMKKVMLTILMPQLQKSWTIV